MLYWQNYPLPNIKLIVFDWDGTLMDSQARIVAAMRHAFQTLQLLPPAAAQIHSIIGLDLSVAIGQLLPTGNSTTYRRIAAEYKLAYIHPRQIPEILFDNVPDILNTLKSLGYFLAIATGKSRAGLNRAMASADITHRFDITRCADECAGKPAPDMLNEIMTLLDTDPRQTLMIGDTDFDLHMARNAATWSAGVTYGAHPKARILAAKPDFIIDEISQLIRKLEIWAAEDNSMTEKKTYAE